jgi:chorismate dehydratase
LLAELNLAPRFIRRGIDILSVWPAGVSPAETKLSSAHRARLLIGDQAIRFRQEHWLEFRFWDLGEEWKKIGDLPFVYALWLARPEVVNAEEIADRLRAIRDENLASIDNLIADEKEFDRDFCRRYYREHLRFTFGEMEKQGLCEFHKRCVKLHLLPHPDPGFEAWDLDLGRRCV